MPKPVHCGSMMAAGMAGGSDAALCAPLAQLKREHVPLYAQMNDFAHKAASIGQDADVPDWRPALTELHREVAAFSEALETHSEREEAHLFTAMARYIGRDAGPIAVMEYEHEQARIHLARFTEAVEGASGPIGAEEARHAAACAVQARMILTDHFYKEENVLLPMAERMLSGQEKEALALALGIG